MSLAEIFDEDLAGDMGEDLGESVTLKWPNWPQDRSAYAIVEEGFVEEGEDSEISRDVLTIELPQAELPQATTRQIKRSLKLHLPARGITVHVYDRRPLGGGAVQLICEIKR